VEALVADLFKDIRGRRFLKWIFDEYEPGKRICAAGCRGIDADAQEEIREAWCKIISESLPPPEPAFTVGEIREACKGAWMDSDTFKESPTHLGNNIIHYLAKADKKNDKTI
jgi:hypothetical protein